MIAQLKGILIEAAPGVVIVDVHGVGYQLHVPETPDRRLPEVGGEVLLHVHTHVREDAIQLFGFLTKAELRLFETVVGVSGIGPRLALAILSHVSVDGFVRAVIGNESAALTKIPGIGKKTAARILLELKDKLDASGWAPAPGTQDAAAAPAPTGETVTGDAIAALLALGYRVDEARLAVDAALASGARQELTLEALIRDALGKLDPTR